MCVCVRVHLNMCVRAYVCVQPCPVARFQTNGCCNFSGIVILSKILPDKLLT
jgi:hypothetical protein